MAMYRRLLTLSALARPLSASARAHRLYHHSTGRLVLGSPSHRLLAAAQHASSSPSKRAVSTAAEADELLRQWCSPPHSRCAAHAGAVPSGADLVVCVASATLAAASRDASSPYQMNTFVYRLASAIAKTAGGPKKAVTAWCADVEDKKISSESLVYALDQIERVLVYRHRQDNWTVADRHADGSTTAAPATQMQSAEEHEAIRPSTAKEMALTLMAARITLEGITLNRVAAASVLQHTPTAPREGSACATPNTRDVDEFTTSIQRVLYAVQHMYWCVCAPVPEGRYPIPAPPLHDTQLLTDVALSEARQRWWTQYVHALTAPVLRPLILSGIAGRTARSSSTVSKQEDEHAIEDFTFSLRILYGLFGRYDPLSTGQRMDYVFHVVVPYLVKDLPLLLSVCWRSATASRGSTTAKAATATTASAARSAKTRHGAVSPQAPNIVGGETHNRMTLVGLALLLLVGYVASLAVPSHDGTGVGAAASVRQEGNRAEGVAVTGGQRTRDYEQLISAIKAK